MQEFYSDDDLKDILAELADEDVPEEQLTEEEKEELEASQRRYDEIIKKYKN